MSAFGPVLKVHEKRSVWDEHGNDVIQLAMDDLAKDVQHRVRSRVDLGVDYTSAMRAQGITVRGADGGLVVKMGKHDGSPASDASVGDLFRSSMQPPTVEGGQLVFRRLRAEQIERRNEQAVKSSFEDAMKLQFPQRLDDAIRVIKSENPDLSF